MQNMLQANPDISIVFAQADGLALGAAQAIKVANPSQKIVVGGFDGDTAALEALSKGVFDVTANAADAEDGTRRGRKRRQARRRREGTAGTALGCHADDQGKRRRFHRQPPVTKSRS